MILLVTFAAIFVVGQAANIAVAMFVEQFSDRAGLFVFFGLFAVVVVVGWQIAVRLVDRVLGPAETAPRTSRSP
jgi:hypothetical protein